MFVFKMFYKIFLSQKLIELNSFYRIYIVLYTVKLKKKANINQKKF